jgi:hypothetical protein
MASPRKPFSELSDAQQNRKLSYFRRHDGLSASEVKSRYNAGTLSQKGARGHRATAEHPSEAIKAPERYRTYRPAKDIQVTGEDRERLETLFVRNITRRLGEEHKWSSGSPLAVQDAASHATFRQLITGINATADELRSLGRKQNADKATGPFWTDSKGKSHNPFWYHGG